MAKLPQKKAVMMNAVIEVIDAVASVMVIAMFMLRHTRWLQQLYCHSKTGC